MGKMPETRLVNQILKALRLEGGWWVKIHGSPMQVSGIPDIIGCYKGQFFALEVKMPEGEVSPRQELILQRISEAGGVSRVIVNPEHALGLIRKVGKRHENGLVS